MIRSALPRQVLEVLALVYNGLQRVFPLQARVRGKPTTLRSMREGVENATRRTMRDQHVQQLLALYPEGLQVSWLSSPQVLPDGTKALAAQDNLIVHVGVPLDGERGREAARQGRPVNRALPTPEVRLGQQRGWRRARGPAPPPT